MPDKTFPSPPGTPALGCSHCRGDCIWLRWSRALLLHLDRRQVGSALECLCQVMDQPSCPFFLGVGSFCASHAADGCYYLMCPDNLILKLSEDQAHHLRQELLAAETALNSAAGPAAESA